MCAATSSRCASSCIALLAPSNSGSDATVLPFLHPQMARQAYEAMVDSPAMPLHRDSAPVKPQRLMAALGERCPPQTRFVADAGNSAAWAVHYLAPHDQRSGRMPGGAYLPSRPGAALAPLQLAARDDGLRAHGLGHRLGGGHRDGQPPLPGGVPDGRRQLL